MARMVRKQILLDEETDARLEALAHKRGVSQGEVVRRALADAYSAEEIRGRRDRAWDALERAWSRAAAAPSGCTGPPPERGWTRDDLYDE